MGIILTLKNQERFYCDLICFPNYKFQIHFEMALTSTEQYRLVSYLGVSCLILLFTFSSFRNIVSQLYDEYGYKNLGQTCLLIYYIASTLISFVSPYVIKKYSYQRAMFLGGIGYFMFVATSFFIITDIPVKDILKQAIVIIGGSIVGIGSSIVVTGMGSYISQVSSPTNKSELFGLYWSFNQFGKIFGNFLIIFVLGIINNFVYSLIVCVFTIIGSLMLLFLPDPSSEQSSQEAENNQELPLKQQITVRQQITKIIHLLQDRQYWYLYIYYLFPGLARSVETGFLYKIVVSSLPQENGEQSDGYNKRLKFYTGLVLLTLAIGSFTTGVLFNRFSERFNAFKFPVISTLIIEAAAFLSLVCCYTQLLLFGFVSAFFWGASFSFTQSNVGALTSKVFPNKVQAYGVSKLIYNIGVVLIMILNIALSSFPITVFLYTIIIIQILMTVVTQQVQQLETMSKKEQLIEDEEQIR